MSYQKNIVSSNDGLKIKHKNVLSQERTATESSCFNFVSSHEAGSYLSAVLLEDTLLCLQGKPF